MIPKWYRDFAYSYDSTRDWKARWKAETFVQMSFGVAQVILDGYSEEDLHSVIDAFWLEFKSSETH